MREGAEVSSSDSKELIVCNLCVWIFPMVPPRYPVLSLRVCEPSMIRRNRGQAAQDQTTYIYVLHNCIMISYICVDHALHKYHQTEHTRRLHFLPCSNPKCV